ncbi:hypothetical protein [Nocardiopsis halophila]|uniref:hypothetical protein n=1 Tax=Nocardiopsis halophila TaxID=141692 RepID=UPI00034BFAA9|nr:hypothetical protein [Nocardiopsis halophila]
MALAFRQVEAGPAQEGEPRQDEAATGHQGAARPEDAFRPPGAGPAVALLAPHRSCAHTAHVVARLLDGPELGAHVLEAGQALPRGERPVIVAPSTAHDIGAAARMLGSWQLHLPLPVLLVAADAPVPMPRIAAHRIRTLEKRVRAVVHLPYLPRLREVDDPLECLTPARGTRAPRAARRVARLRADLLRILTETTEATR